MHDYGANDEATSRARKAIVDLSSGSARLVGSEASLAAPHAALVNGTAAHAFDFDDNYHPTVGCDCRACSMIFALVDEHSIDGTMLLDLYIGAWR